MSRTAAAAATMTLAILGLSGAAVAQTPAPAAAAAPARQPADAAAEPLDGAGQTLGEGLEHGRGPLRKDGDYMRCGKVSPYATLVR